MATKSPRLVVLAMNEILRGDCLELMRSVPDSSIDLILTDPPYYKVKGDQAWDNQWSTPEKFLAWIDLLSEQWQRILKPNGSLYCFASPKMSARVEVTIGRRFNILNNIRWDKTNLPGGGKHKSSCKEALRSYFPAYESIIFAEHFGADNAAKGEAGYGQKCDELRGFVFEPLRAYLDGERVRAGLTVRQVAEAFQKKTGSRTVTGMAGHWFTSVQWTLPTEVNYLWLRSILGDESLRLEYESLRLEYESLRLEYESLRLEYESLRRPFYATPETPYTDTWTFPTVQAYKGKHVCEKPSSLLDHIITTSTNPGAIVLDCFAGSGSTLLSAQRLGRQFIGMELDADWVDQARRSLGLAQGNLVPFRSARKAESINVKPKCRQMVLDFG
jgi:adenine-specific DNA-methyltransferase